MEVLKGIDYTGRCNSKLTYHAIVARTAERQYYRGTSVEYDQIHFELT